MKHLISGVIIIAVFLIWAGTPVATYIISERLIKNVEVIKFYNEKKEKKNPATDRILFNM